VPHERLDKVKDADQKSNVYVSLQDLIKLQYEIRGFSFLPKQPVQSQLTGKHRSKLRVAGDLISMKYARMPMVTTSAILTGK
jgi:hypothetical protein